MLETLLLQEVFMKGADEFYSYPRKSGKETLIISLLAAALAPVSTPGTEGRES